MIGLALVATTKKRREGVFQVDCLKRFRQIEVPAEKRMLGTYTFGGGGLGPLLRMFSSDNALYP